MLIPRSVFSHAAVCADPGSRRYALGGIRVERPAPNGKPVPDPIAVSTDGHRMLVLTWQEENPEEYPLVQPADFNRDPVPGSAMLLPLPACKRLAKLAEVKRSPKPILFNVLVEERRPGKKPGEQESPVVRAFATDLETGASVSERELEGSFPIWRNVVPQYDAGNSVSIDINWKFLADVAKALSEHCDNDHQTVRLTFGLKHLRDKAGKETGHSISDGPVLVTAEGHARKGLAVVMPWTNSDKPDRNEPPHWLPPGELPPAIAALPAAFTVDLTTDEGFERAVAFSEMPPPGWQVQRCGDGSWEAVGPAEEAGTPTWTFDKAGNLLAKDMVSAAVTNGEVPDDDADKPAPDKGDKSDGDESADESEDSESDGPLDYPADYDAAGHFLPEAFMYRAFGTGMHEDGYEFLSYDEVFDECPVKDRDELAAYLLGEYEDDFLEIIEARANALPTGPEPQQAQLPEDEDEDEDEHRCYKGPTARFQHEGNFAIIPAKDEWLKLNGGVPENRRDLYHMVIANGDSLADVRGKAEEYLQPFVAAGWTVAGDDREWLLEKNIRGVGVGITPSHLGGFSSYATVEGDPNFYSETGYRSFLRISDEPLTPEEVESTILDEILRTLAAKTGTKLNKSQSKAKAKRKACPA